MKLGGLGVAGRGLRALFDGGATAGLSDGQLLARFSGRGVGDGAAEAAFEALIARHGPMVWGLCRRILGDPDRAEDAFQATFLILVRKADSIRVDDSLGRWLHGVGVRVATRARASDLRKWPGGDLAVDPAAPPTSDDRAIDVRGVVDEEVARLPAAYRSVVVLCHLEGLTRERAAARLGCPVGTVNSRLSRAGAMLKGRLARRGVAPASALWLASTEGTARASSPVPPALSDATLGLCRGVGSGASAAAGTVPAGVLALIEGTLRARAMMTWIPATLASAALAAGLAATAIATGSGGGQDPAPPSPAAAAPALPQGPGPMIPRPDLAAEVQRARAEWEASLAAYETRLERAKGEAEQEEVGKSSTVDLLPFAGRFLMLAESDVKSPAARDALLWFPEQVWVGDGFPGWGPMLDRAIDLLADHHYDSPAVAIRGLSMKNQPGPHRERFVRKVYDGARDRKAKGYATLALAEYRERVATESVGRKMEGRPHYFDADKQIRYFAPEVEAAIRAKYERDPIPLRLAVARLYEEAIRDYGDIAYKSGLQSVTVGQAAQGKLDAMIDSALGEPARAVEGPDLDGKPLKLADHRGKVVLLAFWAANCPASLDQVPAAKALAGRLQERPFALLGVNCDEGPEAARKAARDLGIAWPSWPDGSKGRGPCLVEMGPVSGLYHVERLPALFVIDAEGAIRGKPADLQQAGKLVDDLLRKVEPPRPPTP